MTAGSHGRTDQPPKEPAPGIPLAALDPATIHRARTVNTSALRAMDGLLDQVADRPDRP